MKLPSDRLSVCPSHPAATAAAGLLISAVPGGDNYRMSIDSGGRRGRLAARRSAANASSVLSTADV